MVSLAGGFFVDTMTMKGTPVRPQRVILGLLLLHEKLPVRSIGAAAITRFAE
jgi:hypothetical protein